MEKMKKSDIAQTEDDGQLNLHDSIAVNEEGPQTDNINIEGTFAELDQIIGAMESPGITLDRSLKLYKQAAELISGAKDALEKAKLAVERLSNNLNS
jgi:exodeoxyribonuclease VII small subunit